MMLIVYRTPSNSQAFDKHYFEVHVPLAKKLPGLKKYEVSKGSILPIAGAKDPYMIAMLHFESLSSIREAFASAIGQACAVDRKLFAPNDATYKHSYSKLVKHEDNGSSARVA